MQLFFDFVYLVWFEYTCRAAFLFQHNMYTNPFSLILHELLDIFSRDIYNWVGVIFLFFTLSSSHAHVQYPRPPPVPHPEPCLSIINMALK